MIRTGNNSRAPAIAAQFPQRAHLPVTPVEFDGNDNSTFRLGEELSVRLPSAEAYAAQVDKEHRWLPLLAPHLPLPIPKPVGLGIPAHEYPWPWSVSQWLDGSPATVARIGDLSDLAKELADFLAALYRLDPVGGPPPGAHNFFRGAPPAVYDAETRSAIAALGGGANAAAATDVWEAALETTWPGTPVWLHGDVSAGNLLVVDGCLGAVIDFGCSAVGDPACDLTIAWTFLSGASREAFRSRLPLDEATWVRGRAWALWKALITLDDPKSASAATARYVLEEVLADSTCIG